MAKHIEQASTFLAYIRNPLFELILKPTKSSIYFNTYSNQPNILMTSHQLPTQASAESSNAAEIHAQFETHEFLQFTEIHHQLRYQTIKDVEVKAINSIDWNQAKTFDPANRLAELLPPDTPWRRFFDILEPSFDELVYEFWSTFYYTHYPEPTIAFRLVGRDFQMSLTEFALRMGIYTKEEVSLPIYTNALIRVPQNMRDYWHIHARVKWRKINDSKMFLDPLRQYVHRVIANTIRGRATNLRRVSSIDLFYMYSIFEKVPCNIVHSLATYFELYKLKRTPKNLMGGSYITRLAKSLGVLDDRVILGLSPPRVPRYVSFGDVKLMPFNQTQSTQFNTTPVNPGHTTPQTLQHLLMPPPQSSVYHHDLQPPQQQQQPVLGLIPTNPYQTYHVQPQTPNIYQALSPLPFGLDIMPQSFYNEDMSIRDPIMTDQPLSPILQLQPPPQWSHEQQQPSNEEAGPSTVPPVNPPLDSMKIDMARVVEQVRRMTIQIEWLTQRNRWQEEMLRQIVNTVSMKIIPPPPSPIDIDSETESDPDFDED